MITIVTRIFFRYHHDTISIIKVKPLDEGWLEIDLTKAVVTWMDHPERNQGIYLKVLDQRGKTILANSQKFSIFLNLQKFSNFEIKEENEFFSQQIISADPLPLKHVGIDRVEETEFIPFLAVYINNKDKKLHPQNSTNLSSTEHERTTRAAREYSE